VFTYVDVHIHEYNIGSAGTLTATYRVVDGLSVLCIDRESGIQRHARVASSRAF